MMMMMTRTRRMKTKPERKAVKTNDNNGSNDCTSDSNRLEPSGLLAFHQDRTHSRDGRNKHLKDGCVCGRRKVDAVKVEDVLQVNPKQSQDHELEDLPFVDANRADNQLFSELH